MIRRLAIFAFALLALAGFLCLMLGAMPKPGAASSAALGHVLAGFALLGAAFGALAVGDRLEARHGWKWQR